jgi:hypothetical protein
MRQSDNASDVYRRGFWNANSRASAMFVTAPLVTFTGGPPTQGSSPYLYHSTFNSRTGETLKWRQLTQPIFTVNGKSWWHLIKDVPPSVKITLHFSASAIRFFSQFPLLPSLFLSWGNSPLRTSDPFSPFGYWFIGSHLRYPVNSSTMARK